jgi:thioesterase domain-containing protein
VPRRHLARDRERAPCPLTPSGPARNDVLTVLLASCSGARDSADSVRDLHALLDAAGVPGPYLLVGFSFGGLLATVDEAKALVAKVPDVPVTYMAARPVELPPNWPVERMQARIRTRQVQFAKTVPNGRLVEAQSSHDIDLDKPELVIQEVQRILDMA